MVTFGYIAIPDPPRDLQAAVPGILACVVGLGLMTCGVLAEARRAEQAEKSASREHDSQAFSNGQSAARVG